MKVANSSGGRFAQSLESGDLHALAHLLDSLILLLLGVAIGGLLFSPNAKERRLQNIEMPLSYEIGEELEKESE